MTSDKNEMQRLYSARYRLRKKGLPLPPELGEEFEAKRAARKAAGLERKREASRRWNRENKAKRAARSKERYTNDPEFREHKLAINKESRKRNKKVLSEKEKQERLLRLREAAAKASRAAANKAALLRETPKPPKAPKLPSLIRKPGRIVALCGWKGW